MLTPSHPQKKFACRMYKTSEDSFDLVCVVLLGNISSPEKLTPTSDAFKQHLERRHYQTAVWGQACIQKPVLPNPEETNWTLADLLVPVFMTLDPIPKACLEMVSMLHWMRNSSLFMQSHVVCTGLCGCTNTDANW